MGLVAVIRAGASDGCVAVLLGEVGADSVPSYIAAKRIDFVADQLAAFQEAASGMVLRDETAARRRLAHRIISDISDRQGDPAGSDSGKDEQPCRTTE